METTFTKNQVKTKEPVLSDKKVWSTPNFEIIDNGYVEGGPNINFQESSTVVGAQS